jgi:hypothetical protein
MNLNFTTIIYKQLFSPEENDGLSSNHSFQTLRFTPKQLMVISWGIHDVMPLNNFTLQFKVSGGLYKGYVQIIYNPFKDHYDISFLSLKNSGKWVTHYEVNGIHFDKIHKAINAYVEYDPSPYIRD